ncbi:MAG: HNH endonuclease [Homavirus sp.]|uniref:HNH endonuclease n=1 Tax=Homavirus sp. TaxID=2487769 RepID=A0A3G5A421_9VIRU|nr:MAG: HNH endonuclease [Homavirus sp.]
MKTNTISKYLKGDQIVYSLEECDSIELELLGSHADDKEAYAIISKQSLPIICDYSWYLSKGGYPIGYPSPLTKTITNKEEKENLAVGIKMHRLIVPHVKKGYVVDHINRNKRDNRLENLRVCTQKENSYNTTRSTNSKNNYKGVRIAKKKKNDDRLWTAYITKDGKKYEITNIQSEYEAAQIYDMMAEELFGEFAGKNL